MKWFKDIKDITELKKEYKRLAFKYHSDRGGDDELMKEINVEYEEMFNILKEQATEKETEKEDSRDFIDIINALMKFDITIEVIGSWLWLHGDTYSIKEQLKELGCRFSKGKRLWYYTKSDYKKTYHKNNNMGDIRSRYGSTVIKETKVKSNKNSKDYIKLT